MSLDVESKNVVSQQYQNSSNLEARISLHERFSVNPLGHHRWIFNQFDLPSKASVLELGCGIGRLWQDNASRIPPNWHITLTDFSSGMLERAKQNTSSINGQFAYEVVDVTNIPFDNNLFDAVIANHMLYHLADKADRARAFSGIRRVLKQGGRFYASTNGLSHMRQMVELVNEFDSSIPFVTHIARNFSLETGPKEVADWFGEVELRRYDNELVVTEVQPLIDFILSTSTTFALEDERKVALSEFVRTRFAERGGVITIKKDPGIICAKRL